MSEAAVPAMRRSPVGRVVLEDQARGVGGGVLAAVPVGQEGPVVVAGQAHGGRVVVVDGQPMSSWQRR